MNKVPIDSLLVLAFKKHYGIALATFISVIGASVVYLGITPPRYQTSAKLIVGEQEVGVSVLEQQLVDKNIKTPGRSADPVATQAELVKTRQVLQRALKNVQQETSPSDEELPDIQALKEEIDVEIVPATNILKLIYHDSDPELAATILDNVTNSVVIQSEENNRSEASKIRKFLETKISEQQARLKKAELAESKYRMAQGQVNLEAQTQSLLNSLTELENEERMLLGQLRANNIGDSLLKQVSGVNSLEHASKVILINEDQEIQRLQSQLKELENEISNLRSYLTDRAPELQALLEQRDNVRTLYQQKLSNIFPGSQSSVSNNLGSKPYNQDLISQYVSSQIENKELESRLKTIRGELSNLRTRVAKIPLSQKPLAELVRQREEAEASLKLLQGKLEEAKIAEARPTSSTRIVEMASINSIPVFPKPPVILVISGFAGIFLATGIVLLLEILEPHWFNYFEAETTFSLPIIGVLPDIPPTFGDPYYNLEKFLDNSELVEPYRALLKTLESSSAERGKRQSSISVNMQGEKLDITKFIPGKAPVIVVSSIAYGEEKSSAALHLGAVAAMLSRRTLIIDADLHQPKQYQMLNLQSYPGLTDVLENPSTFMYSVQSTNIKNLSVLTHGQLSSRPSALIESESMKRLLKRVSSHYDLVIVDASPASISVDAATLSQFTDGLAMLVRPNFIPKDIILDLIAKFKQHNASMLGIVINEVADERKSSQYLNHKTRYLNNKTGH